MTPNTRQIKQLLAIDQLLGMESVPVKKNVRSAICDLRSGERPADVMVASDRSKIEDRRSKIPRDLRPEEQPAAAAVPPVPARSQIEDRTSQIPSTSLAQLDADCVSVCTRCPLCKTRNRTVFGEGDPHATILFVGEGPGADEDEQGRPFVGRAGQLLDKQIAAMGLERRQVYIANIVKCRPPGNRVPTPEEAAICQPYLDQQIALIQPKVIVALGATAAKYLLNDPKLAITRERGTWREYRGIKLMPTFHPAYLLRSYTPENRRRVWDDLKKVMAEVGLEVPKRGAGD
ncbi:MAG: uracil-DNA glycosylase [Phycisphaerales bacterium]